MPPAPSEDGTGTVTTPLHMEKVHSFVAWSAVLSMAYFALLPAVLFM